MGEQMSRWYFAYALDDVNPHILGILEGTFSLGVAHIIHVARKPAKLQTNSRKKNLTVVPDTSFVNGKSR